MHQRTRREKNTVKRVKRDRHKGLSSRDSVRVLQCGFSNKTPVTSGSKLHGREMKASVRSKSLSAKLNLLITGALEVKLPVCLPDIWIDGRQTSRVSEEKQSSGQSELQTEICK